MKNEISSESKPLQPLWDAIGEKQDKIKNSDEITEGKDHLFCSPARIYNAISEMISPLIKELSGKQRKISSADEIPCGVKHKYLTDEMENAIRGAVSRTAIESYLSEKQDKIASSDSIPQGIKNKYYNESEVREMVRMQCDAIRKEFHTRLYEVLQETKTEDVRIIPAINELSKRVSALENKPEVDIYEPLVGIKKDIQELKNRPAIQPVQQEQFVMGPSRTIPIIVVQEDGSQVPQKFEIRGGKISRIFPPET